MRYSATLPQSWVWLLLFSLVGLSAVAAQSAAPMKEPGPLPKSIFMDDVAIGKDPFFPRSSRRGPQVKEVVAVIETAPDLTLKGVSGTAAKRLAIINNRTFEVGEEGELKAKGQNVRVKCVEIKDKSVLIKINGIDRELLLAPH